MPVTANPGSGGAQFDTDQIGGVDTAVSKIRLGAAGVDGGLVTPANPFPVEDANVAAATHQEDTPHTSGEYGQLILAIRSDNDTSTADDGDYTVLKLDEQGRLKVSSKPASYADITGNITAVQASISTPVAGGTVEGDVSRCSNVMMHCTGTFSTVNCTFEGSLQDTGDTNWFVVQAIRTNANTIETTTGNLSAQPAYAWELSVNGIKRVRVRCTARTSGTQSWRFVLGTYATEPIPGAQASATQPVSGTVTANQGTFTAPTGTYVNSAATTNGAVLKASAGTIYTLHAYNNGAGVAYVKLYNSTTVTVGTTTPALVIPIPATSFSPPINFGATGQRFGTGICYAITGGAADNDTTAVAASQVKLAISHI
jgi:hypothetical protein